MTHSSDHETEIKLPISDLSEAQAKLLSIGAKVFQERHFEDNFVFDDANQTLRKNKMLLRIRITARQKSGILTFKGKPDLSRGVKEREEIECEVSDAENYARILSRLGYSAFFRYQKYRTTYTINQLSLQICLDETPIGNYFELEGEIDSIHEYSAQLGFTREQYITESYATLYWRWCQEHGRDATHMILE